MDYLYLLKENQFQAKVVHYVNYYYYLFIYLVVANVDFTVDYAGKTALDLRDELTAMKKNLSAIEEQRNIFRGEMMKYKQILVKKDKEIEDLIMSGHVSTRDRARINTGNKADVLLVRSSN